MRNSIIYLKNDIIVLKDRITEFEGLGNNIKLKMKKLNKKLNLWKLTELDVKFVQLTCIELLIVDI